MGQMTPESKGSDKLRERLEKQYFPEYHAATVAWEDLEAIFAIEEEYVRLVSLWVRGQPNPDTVGGNFLVEGDRTGEVVDRLLALADLQLRLSIEPWPGYSARVHFEGPNIPYGGVGQPTPAAISRKS
jgi:hypothetical protein